MRVFIAEKPSVARSIAKALNANDKTPWGFQAPGVAITSCFGHLLKLNDPDSYLNDDVPVIEKTGKKLWRLEDLPIIPQQFKKSFSDEACKERFFAIKQLLANAQEVVNAGDPDREGQLLVDEVIEACNFKGNVLRYWSSAMDDISVKRALNSLQANNKFYSWGRAAEARSRIDWIIGMNLTRALTLSTGNKTLLTVGRVQTPLLKLINDRNEAIKNFKSTNHYRLKALLNNNEISASLIADPNIVNADGYILDKSVLDNIGSQIVNHAAEIQSFNTKNKEQEPPLPYTLTDLQSDCATLLKLSPKATLDIAQSLYEKHKLISYPRSSCPYLPMAQQGDVANIFTNISKDFDDLSNIVVKANANKESSIWNDKAVDSEAHTAIIPTTMEHDDLRKSLSEQEWEVYKLICKRFVCNFLPNHQYTMTNIKFKINGYDFEAKIKNIINNGFKSIIKLQQEDEADVCLSNTQLSKDNNYLCTAYKIDEHKTIAPKRFTQGSIVKAMRAIGQYVDDPQEKKLLSDNDGLGTEATRAAILDSLFKREYIALKDDYLYITDTGDKILNSVPARYKSISLTAHCESKLEEIKKGSSKLDIVVNAESGEITNIINSIVDNYKKTLAKCNSCGSTELFRFKSKFGNEFVWCCKGCNSYFKDNKGVQGDKIEKKQSTDKKFIKCDCPACAASQSVGRYKSKYKANTFYWYCSECNKSFFDSKDGSKPGNQMVSKKQ